MIRRVPDLCNPYEAARRHTETESRLGVIIEVSSSFWPITTLAISTTNGAVGLSPFVDPLSPVTPAGLDNKLHMATRFGHSIRKTAKPEKRVDKWSTMTDAERKTNSSAI